MKREFHPPDRWRSLGATPPGELGETRLQAHWAAQLLAAAGHSWVDRRPDHSNTSLRWSASLGGLIGEPFAIGGTMQCGLRMADLTWVLLDQGEEIIARTAAAGRSLDDALEWLRNAVAERHGSDLGPLTRPSYEMPDDAIGRGAAFAAPRTDFSGELTRWYDNTQDLLAPFATGNEDALPVRCWPHHFDLATILYLTPGDQRTGGPQVGIGLSPGDENHDEPYLYVTPWPHPEARSELPPLPAGFWRPDGFFGAVLPGSEWAASPDQPGTGARFLNVAVEAATAIARGTPG